MSTFEGPVLSQTVAVARMHKIEPEALLAVVETESAGKSLEIDGRTPCLLFERHIFFRELNKAGLGTLAQEALHAGLANTSWQPATQYKDQGSSKNRLLLFDKASRINRECAIRSCSWGVGQTMGFLAEELKFKNATTMFDYLIAGGVPAQVECMVREIENKKLTPKLNAHNWAGFAAVYNGPGYKKNAYDAKMATAYAAWKRKTLPDAKEAPLPAPVIVPTKTQPSGPVTPAPTVPPKTTGGIVVGTGGAVVEAARNGIDPQWIAFGIFLIALGCLTAFILWKRRQQKGQLGVRSNIAAMEA